MIGLLLTALTLLILASAIFLLIHFLADSHFNHKYVTIKEIEFKSSDIMPFDEDIVAVIGEKLVSGTFKNDLIHLHNGDKIEFKKASFWAPQKDILDKL